MEETGGNGVYIVLLVPYMMIHFLVFFTPSAGRAGPETPCSCCFVCRSNRTRVMNRRSTFIAVFADVSRNSHPKLRASCAPSSLDTSRSYCLSHLLPTSINTGFCRFTFIIAWRKTSNRSKVAREAMEYTRMKPCPSLEREMERRCCCCRRRRTAGRSVVSIRSPPASSVDTSCSGNGVLSTNRYVSPPLHLRTRELNACCV